MINSSVVGLGILLAAVSGLMNGTFTLPMRYLGRWSWENVWALFIVTSCLVMPCAELPDPGFVIPCVGVAGGRCSRASLSDMETV